MSRTSERRAALKAVHPDLGGDAADFIAVMQAFDRAPQTAAASAGVAGAAARTSTSHSRATPQITITTTRRSRTARRARRARRRISDLTHGRLNCRRYAHLLEERP